MPLLLASCLIEFLATWFIYTSFFKHILGSYSTTSIEIMPPSPRLLGTIQNNITEFNYPLVPPTANWMTICYKSRMDLAKGFKFLLKKNGSITQCLLQDARNKMAKAVTFATVILACLLLVEAVPVPRINEIRSMCSYYTGTFVACNSKYCC